MTDAELLQHLTAKFPELQSASSQDNTFLFFGEERNFPLATVVTNDEYDKHSNLSRPGAYRLNIGVSRETFQRLFGEQPEEDIDFTAIDRIMPHPVYGKMNWICVLNPGTDALSTAERLIEEACERNRNRPK